MKLQKYKDEYDDFQKRVKEFALRKLDDRSMEELHRIFDVTGGKEFFDTIEKHSDRKAREMGYDGADDEYMMDTYTKYSNEHY